MNFYSFGDRHITNKSIEKGDERAVWNLNFDFDFVVRAGTIKFHKICHWHDDVLEYGSPDNFNGETFETMHKLVAKEWGPTLGHKGNIALRLMERDRVSEAHRGQRSIGIGVQRQTGDTTTTLPME